MNAEAEKDCPPFVREQGTKANKREHEAARFSFVLLGLLVGRCTPCRPK